VPYLSALEVRSRQGDIQIHVYLYLYLSLTHSFGDEPLKFSIEKFGIRKLGISFYSVIQNIPRYLESLTRDS